MNIIHQPENQGFSLKEGASEDQRVPEVDATGNGSGTRSEEGQQESQHGCTRYTLDSESKSGEYSKEKQTSNDACLNSNYGSVRTDPELELIADFEGLNLRNELLRGIYAYGFKQPSLIQQKGIMPCLEGNDVIVQAQAGSGKTVAYVISVLQQLDIRVTAPQALILVPTREVARQINSVVLALGDFMKVKSCQLVGGISVKQQIAILDEGFHVVVGTPGRVCDMISRRALDLQDIHMLVLDEADYMLGLGLEEEVYQILRTLNEELQVMLLSPTIPPEVIAMAGRIMRNPVRITFNYKEIALPAIQQYFVNCEKEELKLDTLLNLYKTIQVSKTIIFRNTQQGVGWLAEQLSKNHLTVTAIHGDMHQEERNAIIEEFRSGASGILIATDLLARDTDIQQVSLVVNYDLPIHRENYFYRIGRSGRYGRKRAAIYFVKNDDKNNMKDIETYYNINVEELPNDIADLL